MYPREHAAPPHPARAQRSPLLRAPLRVLFALFAISPLSLAQTTKPALHIVADPNNLPFSNDKQEGFENKLATLLAHDLGADLDYTWYPQYRGYVRYTIKHGDSDLVLGVPTNFDPLLTTIPYYRSSYVWVSRTDRHLSLSSLDDPQLRHLSIGVALVGKSDASSPPGMALGHRGLAANVKGFSLYSDYNKPNPPARLIDAVADGTVDCALAWGPLAGYFAAQSKVPLTLSPLPEDHDGPIPLSYDISIGVKRSQKDLRNKLNQILLTRRHDIDHLLTQYHIPHTLPPPPVGSAPRTSPPPAPSPRTRGEGRGEGSSSPGNTDTPVGEEPQPRPSPQPPALARTSQPTSSPRGTP